MTEFLKKITSRDIRNIIAVIIVLGVFALLYIFVIREIPAGNRDLVMFCAGGIVSMVKDVTGYFFGSSKTDSDSRAKKKEDEV